MNATVVQGASRTASEPRDLSRLERVRWALTDGYTITRRNLMHIRHMPEKLMGVTLMPIVFVLLFAYVFGSAISVPGGGNYREYLMPGIFAQTMAWLAITTAIMVATDMTKGLMDRFRSLPMDRSAVLVGQTTAELVENALGLTVMAICGLAIGWRMHNGLWDSLAGFGLLLLFGFGMSWLGAFVGMLVRTPDTANSLGMIVIFPLTFVSTAFVPTEGMPSWLRPVAEWNPLSVTTNAARERFGNPVAMSPDAAWPLRHAVETSIIGSLVLLAIFMPLAIWRFRSAASH
jgi:ABC-2 type transport system permease protein